jgi:hypothetical protein
MTEERIYPWLELYEDGTKTRQQICEQLKISPAAFWYWLRKFRSSVEPQFIDLTEVSRVKAMEIEIELGDALIKLYGEPDARFLRSLAGC